MNHALKGVWLLSRLLWALVNDDILFVNDSQTSRIMLLSRLLQTRSKHVYIRLSCISPDVMPVDVYMIFAPLHLMHDGLDSDANKVHSFVYTRMLRYCFKNSRAPALSARRYHVCPVVCYFA